MAIDPTEQKSVIAQEAEHLILIARDLRMAGDVPLVRFTEDGIEQDPVTLAGELELIAMRLDMDTVMAMPAYDPDRRN